MNDLPLIALVLLGLLYVARADWKRWKIREEE